MNRSTALFRAFRVVDSLLRTPSSATRTFLTQVNQYSHLYSYSHVSRFPITSHQKLFFSSKPSSVVELLLANDWSADLENELESSIPKLNHETVVYVLRKLDKDPRKASDFFKWVREKNGFRLSSSVYSLMLRILARKETMKQFWITLREMKERGFYLDEETYTTIFIIFKQEKMVTDATALSHFYNRMLEENAMDNDVKKAVNVVLRSEWNDPIEKELGDLKLVFSDNYVIRVLKLLRNHPSKALKFFHWVGEGPRFEHGAVTYNAIVRVLARAESIREFWSVVEEMKSAGHEMDYDSYIKISRQFQKSKLMEDAVKLYEHMMDGPYRPSIQDCSILLRSISACENPDIGLVFRVAKKYEATGNSLTKAAYDGIHRSLTSVGRFDEAEKITEVMRNAGYEPDNITYSQLVYGLCKARRLEEACKVLDEMEENGCIPDIKTWTILIQGLCNVNEVDKALLCLAKMMEKNFNADADLLDVLVGGFLSQKRIEGAYKLLFEMVDKARVRPWQATYKLLIEKLLGVRKLEEALDLLRLMKKQNYPPFAEPFVRYISRFGTVEDAVQFLKTLSVKEYPTITAYLHVFEAFFEEGRHSEAKDLLYKCPHHVRKHPKICAHFGSAKNIGSTV